MDSKYNPDELPPPYTANAVDADYQVGASSGTHPDSLTSELLASLPSRIRHTQQAQSVQQSSDDATLLNTLLPEVEKFLAHLGSLHPTPKLAHLTIVPEPAVSPHARLSGMEEMRSRGELCQVVRIPLHAASNEDKPKPTQDRSDAVSGEQVWSPGREFSDWGRFGDAHDSSGDAFATPSLGWWKDEDMARRLARYLQPQPTPKEPAPWVTPVQVAVEQRLPAEKEKKGWFWSKKSSSSGTAGAVEPGTDSRMDKPVASQPRAQYSQPERTKMTVTAQEVAFRRENDFGIVESISGWAVVVAVHVRT